MISWLCHNNKGDDSYRTCPFEKITYINSGRKEGSILLDRVYNTSRQQKPEAAGPLCFQAGNRSIKAK